MNKDFHYYGTYAAAKIAGYDNDSATKIAWAAQMVDDFTDELIAGVKELEGKNVYPTCEGDMEYLKDGKKLWDKDFLQNEATLTKIQRIWVPFHFLPGNFDPASKIPTPIKDYTGEKYIKNLMGEYYFDEDRDKKEFCLMCLHNGPLVFKMIDDTKNFIGGNNADLDKLILIGIRMHVLADTWAHEFFAGTPNYWINDVSNVKASVTHVPLAGSTNYSITYLGHGGAGHLPDYGYLTYKYTAKWRKELIEIDNPSRYYDAFAQMVSALSAFLNKEPISNKIYSDIKEVIKTESTDQTEAWKKYLNKKGYPVDSYEAASEKLKTGSNLMKFGEMAGIHRKFVIESLNDVGISI